MAQGERLLAAVQKAFFGPLRVSVMLDSNGSNTTAVAAVVKMRQAAGSLDGRSVVVTAGSGPVGLRAAGLLAKAGARVTVTSRRAATGGWPKPSASDSAARFAKSRWPTARVHRRRSRAPRCFSTPGPAGVCLIPRSAWVGRPGLEVAADVNAVPPLGVEGIDVTDDGTVKDGVTTFGALGIGGLKMKIHKACIARLFEKNDLVLDAESIAELAESLVIQNAGSEFSSQMKLDLSASCILNSELQAKSPCPA